MSRRFLSGLYPHGLSEHIQRDGFLSGLELAITTKTMHILQGAIPAGRIAADRDKYSYLAVIAGKYVERFQ
jgi:hypothetical protein